MGHELLGGVGSHGAIDSPLKTDNTVVRPELHYPVHTSPARRESLSLGNNHQRDDLALSAGYHRRDCVNLSMNIMTSKPVLDVATNEDASIASEESAAYLGCPQHVGVQTHSPRFVGQVRQVISFQALLTPPGAYSQSCVV